MSRSVSIDIKFSEKVELLEIIKTLRSNDWKLEQNKKIYYMDESFDWNFVDYSEENCDEFIRNEVKAIELIFKNTDIGISLLVNTKNTISVLINRDIKYLDKESYLVDVNWYLTRVILPLQKQHGMVAYNFEWIY